MRADGVCDARESRMVVVMCQRVRENVCNVFMLIVCCVSIVFLVLRVKSSLTRLSGRGGQSRTVLHTCLSI